MGIFQRIFKKAPILDEVGKVRNIADYNNENQDFVKALQGDRKFKTYKEMSYDDATIFGILYIIKSLLIKTEYKIKTYDESKEAFNEAKFLTQCFNDTSHTFSDFIDEILTMLEMGFSYFEIVYKIRKGDNKDSKFRSKYSDNKIGWRKFAFRGQDTIWKWDIDNNGGINGCWQLVEGEEIFLPIEKCLLFRTNARRNDPEGQSLLRGCHKSWYYKNHIEKFEAIGVERDLAGLPVIKIPSSVMNDEQAFNEYKRVVSNIKVDEQNGVVIPSDTKDGNPLYHIELLTAGGSKSFDTDKIITRHDQRIAMSLCADFMMLGQGSSGSWALSTDKTDMFQLSLNAITKKIEEVINSYAIPRLFEANGISKKELPIFAFETVAKRDLTQVANLITALSSAGMAIFPNPEIEKSILDMMGFEGSDVQE